MKVLILYHEIEDETKLDDQDTLEQVASVTSALRHLKHDVDAFSCGKNFDSLQQKLKTYQPDFVFNLVEEFLGHANLASTIPAYLDNLNIPYTGNSASSIFLTSDKLLSKKILKCYSLPTPLWIEKEKEPFFPGKYMIKPICSDASLGITQDSIKDFNSFSELKKIVTENSKRFGKCFAEQFIDGREFNVSMLEINQQPKIMPIAEMQFIHFENGLNKILSYDGKWEKDSFEYKNTIRTFELSGITDEMKLSFEKISLAAWNLFELSGYVRIDYRMDSNKNLFILEVNANPCIAKDSGFFASCHQTGMRYNEMIEFICKPATERKI